MWQQALFGLSVAALAVWLAHPRRGCGWLHRRRPGQAEPGDWLGPALLALIVAQVLLRACGLI